MGKKPLSSHFECGPMRALRLRAGEHARSEMAVVSGSVTKAGPLWRNALREAFVSHAPEVQSKLPIVDAALGSNAPLVGAAENLLDSLKG
ncbi:MAG: hypothetical protein ACLTQI_00830 [Slackia sp.]